jgi:radical SAM enzyme (TIGR01210 family)
MQQNPPLAGSNPADSERTRWILDQRPPRNELDAFKPHAFFLEKERGICGNILNTAVILLTNRECPWRCLMCDLWKNTLTHSVPRGAIPAQIQFALAQLGSSPEQVKLYNSGSFFDSAAIPILDYPAIADALSGVRTVIVESHPRLVGARALRFRDLLPGTLEVAMGLETIHPEVLPQLNKRFELADFRRSCEFLRHAEIGLRAFVLVKPPFLSEEEGVEWAVKSARFAFECGAEVVSLIPTRPGNGALERLMEAGQFMPPRLASLERAQEQTLALNRGRVFADTWDLERFSSCSTCFQPRRDRLQIMNLQQRVLQPVDCPKCLGALDSDCAAI